MKRLGIGDLFIFCAVLLAPMAGAEVTTSSVAFDRRENTPYNGNPPPDGVIGTITNPVGGTYEARWCASPTSCDNSWKTRWRDVFALEGFGSWVRTYKTFDYESGPRSYTRYIVWRVCTDPAWGSRGALDTACGQGRPGGWEKRHVTKVTINITNDPSDDPSDDPPPAPPPPTSSNPPPAPPPPTSSHHGCYLQEAEHGRDASHVSHVVPDDWSAHSDTHTVPYRGRQVECHHHNAASQAPDNPPPALPEPPPATPVPPALPEPPPATPVPPALPEPPPATPVPPAQNDGAEPPLPPEDETPPPEPEADEMHVEPDNTFLLYWRGHPEGEIISADYQWLIGNKDGPMTEKCEERTPNDIDSGLFDCDGWERIMDGDYTPTYLAVSTRAQPKSSNRGGGPVLKCPNDLDNWSIVLSFDGVRRLTYPVTSNELLTVETVGDETPTACKFGLGEIERQSMSWGARIVGTRLGVRFPFVPRESR